ncbi:MAG: hypothetical protein WB902_17985 [Acetobacteraceae bacterium]
MMISFGDCRRLVSDGAALAAICMPFDFIGDREIFHRDAALALSVAEQLIAIEPKISRAPTGVRNPLSPPKTGRSVCHPSGPLNGNQASDFIHSHVRRFK